MQAEDQEAVEAFRRHRHDLLNELQVIRAYLQLGRTGDALRAVDRLADWLRSLARWQAALPGHGQVLWCASQCPHVRLSEWNGDVAAAVSSDLKALCGAWQWLESVAREAGVVLAVRVEFDAAQGFALCVERTEESERWWQTVGESARRWQAQRVHIGLGV